MNQLYGHDKYYLIEQEQLPLSARSHLKHLEMINDMLLNRQGEAMMFPLELDKEGVQLERQDMFKGLVKKIRDTIQPSSDGNQCVAVLLTPLHYHPVEFVLPCDKNVSSDLVVCSKKESRNKIKAESSLFEVQRPSERRLLLGTYKCKESWTAFNGSCFILKQFTGEKYIEREYNNILDMQCKAMENSTTTSVKFEVDFLAKSNSNVIYDFLQMFQKSFPQIEYVLLDVLRLWGNVYHKFPVHLGTYSKVHQTWKQDLLFASEAKYFKWVLCKQDPLYFPRQTHCIANQFQCKDGSCISDSSQCDQENNCDEGEDEKNCPPICFINGKPNFTPNECRHCEWVNCRCGMFYAFKENGCQRITYIRLSLEFHLTHTSPTTNAMFYCNDHKGITRTLVNDLVPDCGAGEDEEEYKKILIESYSHIAANVHSNMSQIHASMMPCIAGHSRTFPRNKLCVVDHDSEGKMRYCRNSFHLLFCKYFECQGMFKCPNLYCLSVHKVCNSVNDCPMGEDETMCDLPLSCPGMLRCKAGFCVDQEYVCDAISHCPDNDDEKLCHVNDCPTQCRCIGAYFDCADAGLVKVPASDIHVFLGNGNKIRLMANELDRLQNLMVLVLRTNKMKRLPSDFQDLSFLFFLDVGDNGLTHIAAETFKSLHSLHILNIDSNPIVYLESSAFQGLNSLTKLDMRNLSVNKIDLDRLAQDNPRLDWLDISDNDIDYFLSVRSIPLVSNMRYIRSDSWQFCCIAEFLSVCDITSSRHGMTDCFHLIQHDVLRVLVWLFSISSLGANMFVTVYYAYLLRNNRTPKHLILLSLAVSDSMTGFY